MFTPRSPLLTVRIVLVLLATGLTVLGVMFVHSTTSGIGDPFPSALARAQVLKAVVGLVGFLVVYRLDYRIWDRYAYLVYFGLLAVLGTMLLRADGINRFIHLSLFQLQPSELMKIGLAFALARYLRYRADQHRLQGLIMPFVIMAVPMFFVLRQPDLGTSLLFPPMLVGMLFVAGARWRYLAVAVIVGVTLLPAAYFAHSLKLFRAPGLVEYQLGRMEAYFNQDEDLLDKNYQLDQSKIAIGSGGWLGKGYNQGTQNKLQYVPERSNDFIFSIIAEELGFVGAASTLLASWMLVCALLRVAMLTREPFGRLVATGLGVEFAFQSLQNMAMTFGLTPITGLTLPFVSLGGSSLVTSWLAVGVACSIASRKVQVLASVDLNPRDDPRTVVVVDDRPAGLLAGH